jgi:hypothetical protein
MRILAMPARAIPAPILLTERDETHEVTLLLKRLGQEPPPGPTPPGAWFSPVEQKVWDALAAGPLRGRPLAAAIHEEYGGRLRMVLSNLVDRGCLNKGPKGYWRANPLLLPES